MHPLGSMDKYVARSYHLPLFCFLMFYNKIYSFVNLAHSGCQEGIGFYEVIGAMTWLKTCFWLLNETHKNKKKLQNLKKK